MTAPAPHRASRASVALGVAGAVLIGVFTATQSRINGELGRALDDGYLAALISFGSGLVILSIVLLVWAPGRRGLRTVFASVRAGDTPWWYLVGGAAGGFFVLSQGLTGATLGVALFTVAIVCGQTISGLVIDARGLGVARPAPVTITRLLGTALALIAVTWAVSSQLVGDIPLWMLLLPFLAGLGIGGQQAVNGQVRIISRSALTATFMNFLVGTIVLAVAAIIHESIVGLPAAVPSQPWLYLGGLLGMLFIGLSVVVVRATGVLLLGLGSVAGQLVTSLVLDLVLPIPGHVFAWTTLAGTLLTLVAVALAAVPSTAVRAPSRTPRG
jgi:transporter family-2 protein